MITDKRDWLIFTGLYSVALTLYFTFAVKEYTWLYYSADSGDYLAAAKWWFVAQAMGNPLYVLLSHAVAQLNGSLAGNMTLLLSSLPGALSVGLTYLLCRQRDLPRWAALTGALSVLSASIFWAHATILKTYMLVTVLCLISLYLYQCKRYVVAAAILGIATGAHVLALFYIVALGLHHHKAGCSLTKPLIALLASMVAIHSVTLALMAFSTRHLMAGPLSFDNLLQYSIGLDYLIGGLPPFLLWQRTVDVGSLLLNIYGPLLAIIGIGITIALIRKIFWLVALPGALIVYFWLNADHMTWTYMIPALPLLGILLAYGLTTMPRHIKVIAPMVAVLLILANTVFLNSPALARANPQGQEALETIALIPHDAIVAVPWSQYSFAIYYYESTHPESHMTYLLFPAYNTSPWFREDLLKAGYENAIQPDIISFLLTYQGNKPIYAYGSLFAIHPDLKLYFKWKEVAPKLWKMERP